MGAQVDPTTQKLIFDRTPRTVGDFQALADRMYEDSLTSVATVAALENVPRKQRGMVRLVEATNTSWVYVSAAVGWRLLSYNVAGIAANPPDTVTLSNPTAFTAYPSTFGTALQGTFVKHSGASRLRMQVDASVLLESGSAQALFVGLRLTANSVDNDYEIARRAFAAAPTRGSLSGNVLLSGIAAGTYAVKAIFKSQAGAALKWEAGLDPFHWTIEEIG